MPNPTAMVKWRPFDRSIPGSLKHKPWPTPPHAPALAHRHQHVGQVLLRPLGDSRYRSGLEVLSRLAGGTTYRTPDGVGARRGTGLGVDDLAHALGFVRDPLDQRLALAFACGTVAEWPSVQELAAPRLLAHLLGARITRSLVLGDKKYRARLMLYEVFHDMALARTQRPAAVSAKQVRMTARDYRALYRSVAGFLETRALEGAHVACCAFFGPE